MILSNGQLTVTKSVRDERASVNQGVKQLDYELLVLIVSVTKFSIVIGSPRAYLSRNRRAITWVSNYRCPI